MTGGRKLRNGWTDTSESSIKLRAQTKAAAIEKIKEHRKRLDAGVREQPGLTVEQLLTEWLAVVLPARVGAATVQNYRAVIERHLIPGLGRHKLGELTAEHVDRFLKAKADAGTSKSYVKRMRTVLTDALNHAERRQRVGRNVGRLSILPVCAPEAEGRSFTAKEADAFVTEAMATSEDGVPKHRLGVMFVVMVMVTLGVRPGEATGLLWEDLASEMGTLAITGSIKRVPRPGGGYDLMRGPVKKSTAGERTLQLPKGLLPLLAAQRRRQEAEGRSAGPLWEDQDLIFASAAGTPLDPSNVRKAVIKVAGITG